MIKYKSVVTDYEGMQAILDTHAAQGWRLFSVTPDTWRKSVSTEGDPAPFGELSNTPTGTQEYSASYYLIIFERDDFHDLHERAGAMEEPLPRHFYEG
jgi:hypothetical protein